MHVEPEADAFRVRYEKDEPQVVWTRLVADLETPVSAYLKVARERAGSFLLESVEGGAVRGRYSIIGIEPDAVLRARGDAAERADRVSLDTPGKPAGNTLDAIRALLEESAIDLPDALPPMSAGVFGFLSYDCVRLIERLPNVSPDPLDLPDALFVRPRTLLIFDNVADEVTVVTTARPDGRGAEKAYAQAVNRIQEIVDRLDEPLPHARDGVQSPEEPPVRSNTSRDDYLSMVARAKEYIAAGDVFQVVLSQRFTAPFILDHFALYRALRRTNPAPFLFFLDFGGFSVVGSSPEILVRVRENTITVRPIAGTRPRGATPPEDRRLADELLADEKERAEHLMLLDLGRNDVGRVAEIGSVRVTDRFFIERYSHVMHIVSNVVGKLDPRHDALSALFAGFPAGTVSGAPKVRAMEIIDELEHDKRGVYAGCVGYFSADGEMDTCIALRTAVVKDGRIHVQAGAGIVADSDPATEHEECVNKAKALFRAAEEARRFASTGQRGQ